jgi:peroxiredoxin
MKHQESIEVPAVGTPAPNFRLASAQGPEVALADYCSQRHVILWFSKGLFCPFCRRQMAQLRLGYPEIQQSGGEILQVTHNTPEEARLYFQQYDLHIPYLCDAERVVHELYGIHMEPKSLVEVARTFAVSTAAVASDRLLRGEKSPSPAPYFKRYGFSQDSPQAVFIVDKLGIIRYVYTSSPIGVIPSNAELLRQLATLQ